MVALGFVLVAFSSVMLVVAVVARIKAYRRPSEMHRVDGHVESLKRVKVFWYSSYGNNESVEHMMEVWRVIVTFDAVDGVKYAHGENLSDEFAESLSVGDTCELMYDAIDPGSRATITGKLRDGRYTRSDIRWLFLFVVMLVVGIVLIVNG